MKIDKLILIVTLAFSLLGCQRIHYNMEPAIVYIPQVNQIEQLPSAFAPLTEEEQTQPWAQELITGDAFARELDLYRAITSYKRARILIPKSNSERLLQIDYDIFLAYYLGRKYQDAVDTVERSPLIEATPAFPAFTTLITALYDCYRELGQCERAESILKLIEKGSAETANDLTLYSLLMEGRLMEAQAEICEHPKKIDLEQSLDLYYSLAKSPSRARNLNAVLPGAGYYYVGQKNSAITSFLINSLFIAAAYQFFNRGYVAAGLITTSIEAGWYLGGINGAGIEAEEYNRSLYEQTAKNMMIQADLFPILTFQTAF